MKLVIYVLCNRAEHVDIAKQMYGAFEWAKVVRIPSTWYLENAMPLSILERLKCEWTDATYVGCIAWRAHEKMQTLRLDKVVRTAMENPGGGEIPDVVAFGYIKGHLIANVPKHHPRFHEVWEPLMRAMEYNIDYDALVPFYYNYWVTTPTLMMEYIRELKRFVMCMETLPEIQDALWSDSTYAPANSEEDRAKLYGVPYYPYHSFVCERFPCAFFHAKGSVIAAIRSKR